MFINILQKGVWLLMRQNITVGLLGIQGLYNYGVEAIVRGTYKIVKKVWPISNVVLYTNYPNEDKKRIRDLRIEVKKIPPGDFLFFKKITNKIFRTFRFPKQLFLWDYKQINNECDIIFSIGGDIYTIPHHMLVRNKGATYNWMVEFGKYILKERPLIIWGASIGPFGEKRKVKNYYFNHLKNVNLIFCREKQTYEYLKSNGIYSNTVLYPDPAFFVENIENINNNCFKKNKKMRISLNLSPLSIEEQTGKEGHLLKDDIIASIIEILSLPNLEIFLIPHVISPYVGDNDLIFLKDIVNAVPEEFKNSITLLENAEGFLGTKSFLRTCDFVISARMHCAINAISEGIPTLFLVYSQKGWGMAEYIYGNLEWAIPILDIKEKLVGKLIKMINNRDELTHLINERIKEIKSEETEIINLLSNIIF